MTDQPPPLEVQRAILKQEIASNRETYWLATLRAKSFNKAGLTDLAKTNAENAAKIEQYIDCLETELATIKD